MKKLIISGGIAAALIAGAAVWLHAATPTVGALAATPAYIVVNTPTAVVFTVQINDSSLVPNGVNLLKVDSSGRALGTVGVMHDDGANGDAVAGDKLFSYRVDINEATIDPVYFRTTAAFKGFLQRSSSGTVAVPIWQRYVGRSDAMYSIGVPPGFELATSPTTFTGSTIDNVFMQRVASDGSESFISIAVSNVARAIGNGDDDPAESAGLMVEEFHTEFVNGRVWTVTELDTIGGPVTSWTTTASDGRLITVRATYVSAAKVQMDSILSQAIWTLQL